MAIGETECICIMWNSYVLHRKVRGNMPEFNISYQYIPNTFTITWLLKAFITSEISSRPHQLDYRRPCMTPENILFSYEKIQLFISFIIAPLQLHSWRKVCELKFRHLFSWCTLHSWYRNQVLCSFYSSWWTRVQL